MLIIRCIDALSDVHVSPISPETFAGYQELLASIKLGQFNWPNVIAELFKMYPHIPEGILQSFDSCVPTPLYDRGCEITAIFYAPLVQKVL